MGKSLKQTSEPNLPDLTFYLTLTFNLTESMSWLFQFIGFVLQSSLWYDWLARKVGWNNLRFVTHMWRLHLDKCYLPNRTWKGERRIIRIFEQSLWKLDTNSMHLKMFIGVKCNLRSLFTYSCNNCGIHSIHILSKEYYLNWGQKICW